MDVQQIRELLELMGEHNISEIKIREGETAIALRKAVPAGTPVMVAQAPVPAAAVPMAVSAPSEPPVAVKKEDEGLVPIRSPMVGTFYATADPESPPFVTIGREVDANSTVCIIEAMKVFNEIKAEVAGTIERVLVQSEQAVEFGQPLMLVRPKS